VLGIVPVFIDVDNYDCDSFRFPPAPMPFATVEPNAWFAFHFPTPEGWKAELTLLAERLFLCHG